MATQEDVIFNFQAEAEGAINEMDRLIKRFTLVQKTGDNVVSSTVTLNKKTGELEKSISVMQNRLPRFKMHMLSLMFAGQLLNRTFGGFVQLGLEAMGILDYFKAIMLDTMIVALDPFLDILFDILDWYMDLPDDWKKLVGLGIILLALGGFALSLAAQLTLTVAALTQIGFLSGVFAAIKLGGFTGGLAYIWLTLVNIWDKLMALSVSMFTATLTFASNAVAWMATLPLWLKRGLALGAIVIGISLLFDVMGKKTVAGQPDVLGTMAERAAAYGLIGAGVGTIFPGIGTAVGGAAGLVAAFGQTLLESLGVMQEGGIVTRPTLAMVGEAGPEAVIPLNRSMDLGLGNAVNTFYINATLANSMDVRRLASDLNMYMVEEYKRTTMR